MDIVIDTIEPIKFVPKYSMMYKFVKNNFKIVALKDAVNRKGNDYFIDTGVLNYNKKENLK